MGEDQYWRRRSPHNGELDPIKNSVAAMTRQTFEGVMASTCHDQWIISEAGDIRFFIGL